MNKKHGMKNTPEYMAWNQMLQRCRNAKHKAYPRYGGRGILVCEAWRESFENFYADIGPRPSPDHSLDRKENSGNYEPGNVRWATRVEQTNNRRNNKMVVYRGRRVSFSDSVRIAGNIVTIDTARQRMDRGWNVEDAVEKPRITVSVP